MPTYTEYIAFEKVFNAYFMELFTQKPRGIYPISSIINTIISISPKPLVGP